MANSQISSVPFLISKKVNWFHRAGKVFYSWPLPRGSESSFISWELSEPLLVHVSSLLLNSAGCSQTEQENRTWPCLGQRSHRRLPPPGASFLLVGQEGCWCSIFAICSVDHRFFFVLNHRILTPFWAGCSASQLLNCLWVLGWETNLAQSDRTENAELADVLHWDVCSLWTVCVLEPARRAVMCQGHSDDSGQRPWGVLIAVCGLKLFLPLPGLVRDTREQSASSGRRLGRKWGSAGLGQPWWASRVLNLL